MIVGFEASFTDYLMFGAEVEDAIATVEVGRLVIGPLEVAGGASLVASIRERGV